MKVLGLDIGGTTIKGAVCDGEEVLFQTKVPTNAQGGAPAILQAVFTLVDKLLPLTDEASPVGVGAREISTHTAAKCCMPPKICPALPACR